MKHHQENPRIPEMLRKLRSLRMRLESASAAYSSLYWLLTSGTSRMASERVTESHKHDKFVSLVIADEKRKALRLEYDDLYPKVRAIIDSIEDDRYVKILTYRYLCGMSAAESARRMSYSKDWERHLHLEALKAFEEAQKKAGI